MSNTEATPSIQYVVLHDGGIALFNELRTRVFFDGFTEFATVEDDIRELEENCQGELIAEFPESQLTEEEVNELAIPYIDAFTGQQVILNFTERELEFTNPNRLVDFENRLKTLMFDLMDATETFTELLLLVSEQVGNDREFDFGAPLEDPFDNPLMDEDGEKLPF